MKDGLGVMGRSDFANCAAEIALIGLVALEIGQAYNLQLSSAESATAEEWRKTAGIVQEEAAGVLLCSGVKEIVPSSMSNFPFSPQSVYVYIYIYIL